MMIQKLAKQSKTIELTLFMPGRVKSTRPVFKKPQNVENKRVLPQIFELSSFQYIKA